MAKKKTLRLPKRIAGIKIPKGVRKSADPLAALLETKAGREALAAGLTAMAAALVGTEKGRAGAAHAGHVAADAGSEATDAVGAIGKAAGDALSHAARHILPSSLVEPRPENAGDRDRLPLPADRKRPRDGDKPGKPLAS